MFILMKLSSFWRCDMHARRGVPLNLIRLMRRKPLRKLKLAAEPVKIFRVSRQEEAAFNKWLRKHNMSCPHFRTGSQSLGYRFCSTAIGTTVIGMCSCGYEVDI